MTSLSDDDVVYTCAAPHLRPLNLLRCTPPLAAATPPRTPPSLWWCTPHPTTPFLLSDHRQPAFTSDIFVAPEQLRFVQVIIEVIAIVLRIFVADAHMATQGNAL